jgi:molybdate transport system substrate-binding protein
MIPWACMSGRVPVPLPVLLTLERTLKAHFLAAATRLGIATVFLMAACHTAQSTEVTVVSVLPLRPFLNELGPEFERASGHKLVIKYDVSAGLKRQIDAGEAFDLALILPGIIDDLVKQGKVAADTRTDLSRAAVAVAVKKGALKPDISSSEAFKRTLLNAKSIGYSGEGGSGAYFKSVLERLGIAIEMSSKLKPLASSAVVPSVVNGEVELAVISPPAILAEPGADLVGILPKELQNYVVYTAGVSTSAKDPEAARSLLRYLMTPAAELVMKAKGLEPVGP